MTTWKEIYEVDLDIQGASSKIGSLIGQIRGVGDSRNLEGLLSGLGKVSAVVGIVGGAALAAKKALDWSMEAESVRSVEKQFELLASQAGVSADKLKAGLLKFGEGLIDDTELLRQANKAMVTLGGSAQRLPEILALARKASAVTGESLSETFATLSQAVATGQTRMLRQMGIVVDQDAAYRKFAESIGTTASALSEAGRRQAIMNEVLATGQKNFANIDTTLTQNTDAYQRLKVSVSQFGEGFAIAFDKVAGPAINSFMVMLDSLAKKAKETLEFLTKEKLPQLKSGFSKAVDFVAGIVGGPLAKMGIDLFKSASEQQLAATEQTAKQSVEAEKASLEAKRALNAQHVEAHAIDQEKVRQQEAAFQRDLVAFRKEALTQKMALAMEEDQFEAVRTEQRALLVQEAQARMDAIEANATLTRQMKDLEVAQVKDNLKLQQEALELQILQNLENEEVQSLERRAKTQQGAWDRFATGAELASAKARKNLKDFSAFGETTTTSLANSFGQAFAQVGAGGVSLADALKKSMVGAVADIAAAEGQKIILSSVFPPNPAGLAAGAALLALSGVLRSAVGATASVPAGGATAGGGGTVAAPRSATETPEAPEPEQMEAQKRKAVTINIQGSYFETDETRTRLVQMVREASDATDFKILSVGGGV